MEIDEILRELHAFATPQKAKNTTRFFKIGEKSYSAGDIFIGVTTPEIRKIAKKNLNLDFKQIKTNITLHHPTPIYFNKIT